MSCAVIEEVDDNVHSEFGSVRLMGSGGAKCDVHGEVNGSAVRAASGAARFNQLR